MVESSYSVRLLELCGSNGNARWLHNQHYKEHQSPCSAWARLNAVAAVEATQSLMPTERSLAKFKVKFED